MTPKFSRVDVPAARILVSVPARAARALEDRVTLGSRPPAFAPRMPRAWNRNRLPFERPLNLARSPRPSRAGTRKANRHLHKASRRSHVTST